jgi:hypothetical protein
MAPQATLQRGVTGSDMVAMKSAGKPTPPAQQMLLQAAVDPTTAQMQQYIQGDPTYVAWETGLGSLQGSSAATRQAAIRALALQYGGLPSGMSDVYGDLTPGIEAQAAANPESTVGQLNLQNQAAQQQMLQQLAARGALHSGDLAYGAQDLAQQYAQARTDAANAFGQNYNAAVDAYTQGLGNYQAGYGSMLGGVETTQAGLHPDTAAVYAQLVPGSVAKYGKPVYQNGPGGTLYSVGPGGSLVPFTGGTKTTPTKPTGGKTTGVKTTGGKGYKAPGPPGHRPASASQYIARHPGAMRGKAPLPQRYRSAAAQQYVSRHPGAVKGKAPYVPRYARAAVRQARKARKI